MTQELLFEIRDSIGCVTLNRPAQHNPLTPRCVREILRAVEVAGTDEEVRALIIRSTGRSFSSGYGYVAEDVEEGDFAQHGAIEGDVTAMIGLGSGWARVWDCPIPVIAQVHGNCLAGGTDLALHCDLVVAAEDARIGFPPVRSMGVPPTHMWLYNVGPQWTKPAASSLVLATSAVSALTRAIAILPAGAAASANAAMS